MTVDEIACRELVELATEYLEGALPDDTDELVQAHLAVCEWCRLYIEQLELTATAAAAVGPGPAAPLAETLAVLLTALRRRTPEGPAG